jgi:hypothetical protein
MKLSLFYLAFILAVCPAVAQPIHSDWNAIVQRNVSEQGNVNYADFSLADRRLLQSYLQKMGDDPPGAAWSEKAKLAYWINIYNAVTLQLILNNYPVKSIQDLHPFFKIPGFNTVWHHTYFYMGDKKISLDEIEHELLRKEFDEPRIHFAINCASKSCPKLRNEAYTAARLETQLNEQATYFINTPFYNSIAKEAVELSKIFSWFKGDFTKQGDLIHYLNQYSKVKIQANAAISYKEYNWELNE